MSRPSDRRAWLIPVLRQRCKPEQNWCLNKRQEWAYTLKALICLVLHLHDRSDEDYPDMIEVAYANYSRYQHFEFGDAADWDYLAVGYGWRNWWYLVSSTGYP